MPTRLLLGVAAYFLALTYSGLFYYFDSDDMMNLYGAWHNFAGQVRPVGALFYRFVFGLAGFDPLPFRVGSFLLLLVNLYLMARLLEHLGRSRTVLAAGLFFGCFQGTMWSIYASTGTIYDVLCATFLYSALLVAIERPGWWPVVCLLHGAAIGSKELGVTMPLLLVLYSILYERVRMPMLVSTGLVSMAFAGYRLFLPHPLSGHDAYTPAFTMARLLENVTIYTNILTSHAFEFSAAGALLLWLGAFALAGFFQSRRMLFGLGFFWIALAPMLVATPRHVGYVFYVPFLGLALYVGALAANLRTAALVMLPPPARKWWRPALAAPFIVGVLALHLYQRQTTFARGELPGGGAAIRRLAAIELPLQAGQRVLLLNSQGLAASHLGTFTLSLRYGVRDVSVHEKRDGDRFDHVYDFRGGVPSFAEMNDPRAGLTILSGVGPLEANAWRWTGPDPRLQFTAPDNPAGFVLDYAVPDVTFAQTGPLDLQICFDGEKPQRHRIAQAGPGTFRMKAPVQPGKLIEVCLHIDKPYVSPGDGAKLGLILTRAGFE